MTQGTGKQNGKHTVRHIGVATLLACLFGSQAYAQAQKDCVKLDVVAQVEKEVVDAKGAKTRVLEPAAKVVPGTEVVYSLRANNVCQLPSEKVVINNPVPEHMVYVPNSAYGAGSDITFSIDGKTYASAGELRIQENGVLRPARADEVRYIRWEFKSPLKPGASAAAQFRAALE
jgi:uncharacterized repeat protein (TIGR01451 family)